MKNEIKTYPHSHTYGEFDLKFEGNKNQEIDTASASTQEAKGVAEVQASFVIAKKFPRNENECYMKMINSCKRASLAEQAMYAYPRGGQMVTGPSIRLAEVLAQKWSNLSIGIEIVSQTNDKTEAKAFAIDRENNFCVEQYFTVKHQRTTKKGVQRLTDERDIRELVANIGSRNLRGCILRIIPGDIVEAAVEQCKKTLESSDIPIAEQTKRLIIAFDEMGVKVEHIEKRLGHNLEAIIPQEIVTLRSIFKSLKDGMAKREDFFDIASNKAETAKEELKALLEKNKTSSSSSSEIVNTETGEVVENNLEVNEDKSSVFGDNDKVVEKLTKDKK